MLSTSPASPATASFRLGDLPGAARLALALFVFLLLGGYAAAQATLFVHAGGGSFPGPAAILERYHGRADRSRLHDVLDPARPSTDARAMWVHLDPAQDPAAIEARRQVILGWAEAGAPREGWSAVATVLHREATCLSCHAFGAEKQDLPFETYEQVLPVAARGGGMPLPGLVVSAHAHAFGFALLAVVLAVSAALTAAPGLLVGLLALGAFGGAALDVGGWFLTRVHGAPWHLTVLAGGALFGTSCALLGALVLLDIWRGRRRRAGGPKDALPR